jgi:exodeoxyribonuclease-3
MKFAEKFERGGKAVVVCGDFNIAHEPIDLARPDDNEESPGYLPAEREWMGHFLAEGWIDTFRHFYPRKENAYSWWSARTRARERNIGWRIDYHAVNADAKVRIKGAGIQDQVMGSDHCPVTLELSATL